jgi:hypothetical protein
MIISFLFVKIEWMVFLNGRLLMRFLAVDDRFCSGFRMGELDDTIELLEFEASLENQNR